MLPILSHHTPVAALFPVGASGDPANWFRTSLYSNDFDSTLAAALSSAYADDYVLVVDTATLDLTSTPKVMFPSGSSESVAEVIFDGAGSIFYWPSGATFDIAGPAIGNRTLRLNVPGVTIPTINVIANDSAEIVGDVYIEGIGGSQQPISDVSVHWAVEHLHLVNLNASNVFASGANGDATEYGTSGDSPTAVYGNHGVNGTDADFSMPATGGTDGDSAEGSESGSAGGSGTMGNNRAVEHIYLNGCLIGSLYARNSNGSAGGNGGSGQMVYGGNGGNGGNGSENYPDGAPGGNGGSASATGNGGNGGSGGDAYQYDCYTHGTGSPSQVNAYYGIAYGGSGGAGGSKGLAVGGASGSGGAPYGEGNPGPSGSAGSSSSTGQDGTSGTSGANCTRILDDPDNKITFGANNNTSD